MCVIPLGPCPFCPRPTCLVPLSCNALPVSGTLLITGGGRGIGAATARLAAQRGYAVCLGYRANRAAAEAVSKQIVDAGGRALAVAADVSVEADVLRLFEQCTASLGAPVALVNNAGVLETQQRL